MTRFERLPADVRFDDLSGPPDKRERLEAIRDAQRNERSFQSLFHGPRGAGKTFAARALANELDKPIFRVDLSQVVTESIGETEKNLTRILDDATEAGAIVLIDDADDVLSVESETAELILRTANGYPGHVIFEMRPDAGVPRGLAARFASVIEFLAPHVDMARLSSTIRSIAGVATRTAGFVGAAAAGPVDQAVDVTSLGEAITTFGGVDVAYPMSHAVAHFFENGGTTASIVRVTSGAGGAGDPITDDDVAGPALEPEGRGLWALRDTGFSILVIPPLAPGTDISAATRRAGVRFCAEQRAFSVFDPPSTWQTVADVAVADLGLVDHLENAAVYWPQIEAADGAGGSAEFGAAGAVAGLYARVDAARGVWKAPAGTEARLVATGLSAPVADDDAETLTGLGVNPLRSVAGGFVVWGARTLSSDPEWRYVPVRRTALFLERSITAGLEWVAFEPNDEPLWAQIRLTVDAFLADLWTEGAFQGSTPDEAYFVRCDRSTTSQADIDRRIVRVVVGFAPLQPAEFVVLELDLETA